MALLLMLVAGAGSFFSIRALIPYLSKNDLFDIPGSRSSHSLPTPRGAGLALTPLLLVLFWLCHAPNEVLFACLILFILSAIDDMKGLAPFLRLGVHIIAVLLALSAFEGTSMLFLVAAGIFWVGFLNLYNFMDGIDGITAAETIALSLGVMLLTLLGDAPHGLGFPAAALLGASVGFLLLNWHPAKIFLGDSGSVPLGFLMGWMLLDIAQNGEPFAALILPAYYLTDSAVTLLRRIREGKKPWEAHREHAYQRVLSETRRHPWVVQRIAALNVGLILLALVATLHPIIGLLCLLLAYGASFGMMQWFLRISDAPLTSA